MNFIKEGDEKTVYKAFKHFVDVGEADYPDWLKAAVKKGDVYTDEVDGQLYIKGELNPLTNEYGRSAICENEWVVLDPKGVLTPYPEDHFLENYIPA